MALPIVLWIITYTCCFSFETLWQWMIQRNIHNRKCVHSDIYRWKTGNRNAESSSTASFPILSDCDGDEIKRTYVSYLPVSKKYPICGPIYASVKSFKMTKTVKSPNNTCRLNFFQFIICRLFSTYPNFPGQPMKCHEMKNQLYFFFIRFLCQLYFFFKSNDLYEMRQIFYNVLQTRYYILLFFFFFNLQGTLKWHLLFSIWWDDASN